MSYISYWKYDAVRGDVDGAAMGLSLKRFSSAMPGRAKLFDDEVAKIAERIEIERMQAAQYGQVFPVSNFLEIRRRALKFDKG